MMKYIKLDNGVTTPIIGSGTNTYGKVNNDYRGEITNDTTELQTAISAGYRYFDTAVSYRNEGVVGKAWSESAIPREEFFLVSKIPNGPEYVQDEAAVDATVQASLEALRTDYIDLYLIHHPWDDHEGMLAVWKVLEKHVDQGNIRAIGVSNFSIEQLQLLLDHGKMKPVVNQVESHPGEWNHEVIEFGRQHGIYAQAWGPLTRVSPENRELIGRIGEKYGKSWAQVILNFQIDRDVIVIPKSHNPERQQENLDIFDFHLTDDEKEILYNT